MHENIINIVKLRHILDIAYIRTIDDYDDTENCYPVS